MRRPASDYFVALPRFHGAGLDCNLAVIGLWTDTIYRVTARYALLRTADDLDALDQAQYALSVRRNVDEGRYFPGFFTALYERSAS